MLAYAAWSNREVSRGDRVLDEPDDRRAARRGRAGAPAAARAPSTGSARCSGPRCLNLPRRARAALRSRNVRRLADDIERARKAAVENGALTAAVAPRRAEPVARRRGTARDHRGGGAAAVKALEVRDAVARVEALATFTSTTSDAALGKCMESMRAVTSALSDRLLWQSVESLVRRDDADARALVEHARRVLSADETKESLQRELPKLSRGGRAPAARDASRRHSSADRRTTPQSAARHRRDHHGPRRHHIGAGLGSPVEAWGQRCGALGRRGPRCDRCDRRDARHHRARGGTRHADVDPDARMKHLGGAS
jgi:hypothetical protein